ncbi:acyl-CoA dehydrogenase family protein [Xylona heveae TC161]|uniref:Acyl-CoA dehydrogenase family protein n=1 Tax=Xylona heveae (strain CBS 132557 / TC161) TaxID=1328760 RepID=A0A165GW81_XYLHT|nr:acyl-CoA dehydrogenase family protein [Xylona heveae TC161]KZF22674.1 acyl-CoA dehydrogenase family protein [Xylona heveae TC161]
MSSSVRNSPGVTTLAEAAGNKRGASTASQNIPLLVRDKVSERAKHTLDLVEKFVEEECIPADPVFLAQIGQGDQRWSRHPRVIDDLKARAKEVGLWNMFLPKNHYKEGAGFTNLEYGLMAEYMGKSRVASEVSYAQACFKVAHSSVDAVETEKTQGFRDYSFFDTDNYLSPKAMNCAAPDTGNMEVLAKYGNDAQQEQWLKPLLNGDIRSAFLMTEPGVASSDATNITLGMKKEGNDYIINGSKWWSSGAGDPRCMVYIVMGKTDPTNQNVHKQQSVLIVPANTKGITVERMMSVYGYDDAPHGHGHIIFNNVRVPAANLVLGEGRGFEIIQGRLGPGRIHHAMRSIGAAEKALEWMLARVNDSSRKTFGKQLNEHGVILEWIAKSRLEIDAARLIVLNAAAKIDESDAKSALKEIAEAKVLAPQVALTVIDRAVQCFGAAGVSQDTPLASMWAQTRTLRIADGPDEVHLQQMGRSEDKYGEVIAERLRKQKQVTEKLFQHYGLSLKSNL